MDNLHIEYIPTTSLKAYDRNARTHRAEDVAAIKESIQQFGFNDPIGVWKDNLIIEGHGRLMAAQELGMEEVPVIRLDHLTDEERRAYALAHNRTAELSEWNFRLAESELKEIATIDMSAFQFEIPDNWFEREQKDGAERQEGNDEYNEFLDKFEQKKTTDDCYTPNIVYQELAKWVSERYEVSQDKFIRPFYPGGNYKKETYEDGSVVVDNPPFSILSEILKWYVDRGIKFFLFAPALTLFSGRGLDICYIPAGVTITYENGAKVNTAFITNLEPGYRIRTTPDLYRILTAADKANRNANKSELSNYEYPPELVTAAMPARYSVHGVNFDLRSDECVRVSDLDAMKESGKGIYGGGFLISEEATKRNIEAARQREENAKRAAEKPINEEGLINEEGHVVWQLSEREREIVRRLGEKGMVEKENHGSD